ncbi:MAG TPA: DNA mismatch repair endonuclease MutL [Ktedonobacteraceae bacterium]|nr:DNA mismatch repair endonuclease MutL [Ktedonobacteraceae bacterium]
MTITQRMNIPRTPIQPLSQDVAERIAAGEVIERPVSVVKELVENALDAGAREIRVEIRGGGLSLVRVSDDGIGVPASELEQALARHTTSKIRNVEDLHSLYTLGFRGEALASIAAVSEVMLVSRALESEERGEESPAVSLTMRGGEVTQRGHAARLHPAPVDEDRHMLAAALRQRAITHITAQTEILFFAHRFHDKRVQHLRQGQMVQFG